MRYSHLIISILFSILPLLFSGCAGKSGAPGPVRIDKSLPQPSLNGYLSDTNAIAFEWKPISDHRVMGIRIYRDNPGTDDRKVYRIATVEDTLHTHYVDTDLTPATKYRYRFTTYDSKGQESMPNKTFSAKTLPLPEPVSFFTATKELARSAKLIWRPHPDLRITGYRIERLDPGDEHFHSIEVIRGRLNAEYIDHDLGDDLIYRYRVSAIDFNGQQTAPSKVVTVSTKPLPQPPKQLQAQSGGIRSIPLQWEPSGSKDVVYYNVYRSDSRYGSFDYRAKIVSTRFTDKTQKDGERYFYYVTAVDKDGLESLASATVTADTKAPPNAPRLLSVSYTGDAVVVRWESGDPRTQSYILAKTTHTGWFESKKALFKNLKNTTFTDANIVKGQEYSYAVLAVDANGLISEPSESKTVLPEAQ